MVLTGLAVESTDKLAIASTSLQRYCRSIAAQRVSATASAMLLFSADGFAKAAQTYMIQSASMLKHSLSSDQGKEKRHALGNKG